MPPLSFAPPRSPRWLPMALLWVCVVLTGCAGTQPIARDASAALRGQTLAVTARQPPQFTAYNPNASVLPLFGVIGSIASDAVARSAGRTVEVQAGLTDPAGHIARALVQTLQATHGTRPAAPLVVKEDAEPSALALDARPQARFLLDVRTATWGMSYVSFSRYHVGYAAVARLIDTQTGQTVALGECRRPVPSRQESTASPTYDELLADGGALLKRQLQLAADECIGKLRQDMGL